LERILDVQRGHILKSLAPSPAAPEREVIDAAKIDKKKRPYWKSNIDFGYEGEGEAGREGEREGEGGEGGRERERGVGDIYRVERVIIKNRYVLAHPAAAQWMVYHRDDLFHSFLQLLGYCQGTSFFVLFFLFILYSPFL
jgi:hypothetical protein